MRVRRGAAALLLLPLLLLPALLVPPGAASGALASPQAWRALFRVADPRIDESSGLVDLGRWVVTANDSGNAPDVFVLDPRSGRTVGITRVRVRMTDVEALAPAGRSAVWYGDIGDNTRSRRWITVYRVPVAPYRRLTARPATYRLAYPDGRHDAESMFVDRAGRLYVIAKSFLGGGVYRTPRALSTRRVNRLQKVGGVWELATDAAMMRDGRHVLVRGYGSAAVYRLSDWRRVASFTLPLQKQGEGVSVGPTGRILLSSEGLRQVVDQMWLPAVVTARLTGRTTSTPSPSASPTPTPTSSPTSTPTPTPTPTGSPAPSTSAVAGRATSATTAGDDGLSASLLAWSIPAVIVVGALGIGVALRRRSS